MPLLLSALLLVPVSAPAIASTWSTPSDGFSSIDPVTGEQTWTESFGGEGTGGDSGSSDSFFAFGGAYSNSNGCGSNGGDF